MQGLYNLQPGDPLKIVASAGRTDAHLIDSAIVVLEKWPLSVQTHPQVFDHFGYFAGTDEIRTNALQEALDDPNVKVILCARGGYGTTRILDRLNFSSFQKNPKWIIGFSDITALLLKIENLGYPSIHGPVAIQFGKEEYQSSIDQLKRLLFRGNYTYSVASNKSNIFGDFVGNLTGGNLSLVADSLGTSNEIETENKILFLEEIGEDIYRVDRMLHQLKRAGKLDGIGGIILGYFTSIRDTKPSFGYSLQELILQLIPKNIPLAWNFPAGHDSPNFPLVIGARHHLSVGVEGVSLSLQH